MTENLKVVLFTSRNKDNKDVPGFKQRSKTFLTTKIKMILKFLMNLKIGQNKDYLVKHLDSIFL